MTIVLSRRAVITTALAGVLAVGGSTLGVGSPAAFGSTGVLGGTAAQAGPVRSAVVAHFDLAAGQMPENIVLDRDGSVDLTFAASRQVARVAADGSVRILATLPAPADPGAAAPVLGFPLISGLVRDGRTFYVAYASGTDAETGVWKFTEGGGTPRRIAALPGDGLPNGMAMDNGTLYVTDSVRGAIYTVSTRGDVRTFSSSPALAATGLLGVNGVKVRDGALYVSNLDQGTILRLPIRHQRAGAVQVVATGLAGIDDFAFTGRGNEIIAALISSSEVVLVDNGRRHTVLTAADGLSNPTSVAVRGRTILVPSAAYLTQTDPNLLVSALPR